MHQVPRWFNGVAIAALLWNILGCIAFVMDARLTPADVAKLPEAQQALYAARPVWALAATAVAVFGGAPGSIALLMKRKWALVWFLLSLLGIIVQDVAMFGLADGLALAGAGAVALQFGVLLVAVLLVVLRVREDLHILCKSSVASPVQARTGSRESITCVIDSRSAIHGQRESSKNSRTLSRRGIARGWLA